MYYIGTLKKVIPLEDLSWCITIDFQFNYLQQSRIAWTVVRIGGASLPVAVLLFCN